MELQVTYKDASEPDCLRMDFYVTVDGTEYCICPCALGSKYSRQEALETAQKLFGPQTTLLF